MSDSEPSAPLPPDPPAPRLGPWTGIPWIWAVPVLALLVVAWLAVQTLAERGPTITISFVNGEGIEAGRTTIRYKNVELGRVAQLGLSADRSRVVVTAEMRRDAEPLLRAQTAFWVVRPRVGFSGISGLSTIVSGSYIGTLPGEGEPGARTFTGTENPPPQQGLVKGRDYTLVADRLPPISDDAPVYFHGVKVGEVTRDELSDRDGKVLVHIFIYDPR